MQTWNLRERGVSAKEWVRAGGTYTETPLGWWVGPEGDRHFLKSSVH